MQKLQKIPLSDKKNKVNILDLQLTPLTRTQDKSPFRGVTPKFKQPQRKYKPVVQVNQLMNEPDQDNPYNPNSNITFVPSRQNKSRNEASRQERSFTRDKQSTLANQRSRNRSFLSKPLETEPSKHDRSFLNDTSMNRSQFPDINQPNEKKDPLQVLAEKRKASLKRQMALRKINEQRKEYQLLISQELDRSKVTAQESDGIIRSAYSLFVHNTKSLQGSLEKYKGVYSDIVTAAPTSEFAQLLISDIDLFYQGADEKAGEEYALKNLSDQWNQVSAAKEASFGPGLIMPSSLKETLTNLSNIPDEMMQQAKHFQDYLIRTEVKLTELHVDLLFRIKEFKSKSFAPTLKKLGKVALLKQKKMDLDNPAKRPASDEIKSYRDAIPYMLATGSLYYPPSLQDEDPSVTTGGIEVEFSRLKELKESDKQYSMRERLAGTTHLEYINSNQTLLNAPLKIEGDAAGKIELVSPPIEYRSGDEKVLQNHWNDAGKYLAFSKNLGEVLTRLNSLSTSDKVQGNKPWTFEFKMGKIKESVSNYKQGTGSAGPYKMGFNNNTEITEAGLKNLPIGAIINKETLLPKTNVHFNEAFNANEEVDLLSSYIDTVVGREDAGKAAIITLNKSIAALTTEGWPEGNDGIRDIAIRQFLDSSVNGAIFAPYLSLKEAVKKFNFNDGLKYGGSETEEDFNADEFLGDDIINVSNYDSNYKDRFKTYYKVSWEQAVGDLDKDQALHLLNAFEKALTKGVADSVIKDAQWHWANTDKNRHNSEDDPGVMSEFMKKYKYNINTLTGSYLVQVENRIKLLREVVAQQKDDKDQAISIIGDIVPHERVRGIRPEGPMGVRPDTFVNISRGRYLREHRKGGL